MSAVGTSGERVRLARQVAELKMGGGGGFPRELMIGAQRVGVMRSVQREDLRDEGLIAQLQRWRNQSAAAFFTQFEATTEGTQRWLAQSFDDNDRALFLIFDERGRAVGQCGARNIAPEAVECDAILRGERHGHPFLMTLAERALVDWLFNTLGIRRLYAQVFADNVAAIRLFLGLGMMITRWIWFERRMEGNAIHYVLAAEEASDRRKVAWLEMENPQGKASP
jgi:RimJ/RimL family protein N-acetyltransferase